MPYTRKNVWELGGDWADTILWYARGVAAMKARALAEPTSWNFYGAIHGIDTDLWGQFGYLSPSTPMPSSALQNTFWNQCQHGSWYFLPWHRGYLLAFEANVRAEVIKLGGPADWALPYWNYFKSGQSALPPAFASANWPDGQGNNPLFVPQRYGPNNDGKVFVPLNEVNLKALKDPTFTGVASAGSIELGINSRTRSAIGTIMAPAASQIAVYPARKRSMARGRRRGRLRSITWRIGATSSGAIIAISIKVQPATSDDSGLRIISMSIDPGDTAAASDVGMQQLPDSPRPAFAARAIQAAAVTPNIGASTRRRSRAACVTTVPADRC
jgi:hypothetical protein